MENKYVIIMLDSAAPSFCYYQRGEKQEKISAEDLRKAIEYCRKNGFFTTIIYPEYQLDPQIQQLLESFPHIRILPPNQIQLWEDADLVVVDYKAGEELPDRLSSSKGLNLILRLKMSDINCIEDIYYNYRNTISRLSVVITDIVGANEHELNQYRLDLIRIKDYIYKGWNVDCNFQISLITDRLTLTEMNNCNAGESHFTIAPNGKFYICPGFYLESPDEFLGAVDEGIYMANKQLLTLKSSPICSLCDCYHCKRCIYLNKKTTLELNTPSHEQCVISHHERNTTGALLEMWQKRELFPDIRPIRPLFYLDPFDLIK